MTFLASFPAEYKYGRTGLRSPLPCRDVGIVALCSTPLLPLVGTKGRPRLAPAFTMMAAAPAAAPEDDRVSSVGIAR